MKYLVAISGGLDSTYAAYLCFHRNFNALLCTIDAGWSSPQADNNIDAICGYTDYHLVKYTIPTDALNKLRKAFLRSNTLHAECPADIAYQALLYKAAKENNCDMIVSGMNSLEGSMPADFSVVDSRYIKSVWRRFGEGVFPDFPMLSMWEYYKYKKMVYRILDTIDYNPVEALRELKKIGFEYYSGKHLEDDFTKFNQGLRFFKFNVDVRGVNFKAMVRAGKMTVEEMYNNLSFLPYSFKEFLILCKVVENRIGIKIDDDFLTQPLRSWVEFKSWRPIIKFLNNTGIKRLFRMPY